MKKSKFKSGDLVFASGNSFTSRIIGMREGEFSHVGMLIKDIMGKWHVMESTLNSREVSGVVLTDWETFESYGYKRISVRRLIPFITTSEIIQCKREFLNQLGKPYEKNIRSLLGWMNTPSSLSCNELISRMLVSCGRETNTNIRLSRLLSKNMIMIMEKYYNVPYARNIKHVTNIYYNRKYTEAQRLELVNNTTKILFLTI
jgi:hypothetical protein